MNEENKMEIVESGHLWVGVSFNNKRYSLTYNFGIDATVIFQDAEDIEAEGEKSCLTYVNYFQGGFNWKTCEQDADLLENAEYYIKEAEKC